MMMQTAMGEARERKQFETMFIVRATMDSNNISSEIGMKIGLTCSKSSQPTSVAPPWPRKMRETSSDPAPFQRSGSCSLGAVGSS